MFFHSLSKTCPKIYRDCNAISVTVWHQLNEDYLLLDFSARYYYHIRRVAHRSGGAADVREDHQSYEHMLGVHVLDLAEADRDRCHQQNCGHIVQKCG